VDAHSGVDNERLFMRRQQAHPDGKPAPAPALAEG
jgi:hypothetical protein